MTTSIVCDGNSLTWMSNSYPTQIAPLLSDLGLQAEIVNLGIPGEAITNMIASAPTRVDPLYSDSYDQNIVICWEGTNDLYYCGDNGGSTYSRLVTYCQARRAVGFKVIILTVLPESGPGWPSDFDTQRATCNALIRTNWPTFADALADVTADPRIGDDSDSDDTTYYIDKVHMTTAGYTIVTDIVLAALETIIYGGTWMDDSPTLTASVTNPTLGVGSSIVGRHSQIGQDVKGWVTANFGTSGVNAGSGFYEISLPVAARSPVTNMVIGSGIIYCTAGNVLCSLIVIPSISTTTAYLCVNAGLATETIPAAFSAGCTIDVQYMYEAA